MQSAEKRAVTNTEQHDHLIDQSLVSWLHALRAGDHDWEDAVQTTMVELLERARPGQLTWRLVIRRCTSRYSNLLRSARRRLETELPSDLVDPVAGTTAIHRRETLTRILSSLLAELTNQGMREEEEQAVRVAWATRCRDSGELAGLLRISKWSAARRLEKAICAIKQLDPGEHGEPAPSGWFKGRGTDER